MRFIDVVIARILLILLPSGGLASITFLTEGEVEVVAVETDPVSLPRHRCHN